MGDERLKMNTGVIIHFSLAVSEVVGDVLKLGLGESLLELSRTMYLKLKE